MSYSLDDGDPELIAAAQKGERAALDLFVRRHDRWVRGIVYATAGRSALLDDVVQHVWTTVWEQIGTLVDPLRWRGWLYRIARNAAIDAGEKAARRRRRVVPLVDETLAVDREGDPAQALVADEKRRRILQTIQGLPAIYREPFVMRHLQEWTYAQIGEALSLPVDTVETRLVRARRLLREALRGLE